MILRRFTTIQTFPRIPPLLGGGVGELKTTMQAREEIEVLHNCQEFLHEVYTRLYKHGERDILRS